MLHKAGEPASGQSAGFLPAFLPAAIFQAFCGQEWPRSAKIVYFCAGLLLPVEVGDANGWASLLRRMP